VRTLHQGHSAGQKAPGDHDPSDPAAGANLFQEQVARHFAEEIGHEEKSAAQAKRASRQAEVADHLQRGEAQIDAVQEGDEITEHQEGQDSHGNLPHRSGFERVSVAWITHRIGRRRHDGAALSGGIDDTRVRILHSFRALVALFENYGGEKK
jgi:hypothetical protein